MANERVSTSWEFCSISEVADLSNGGTPPKSNATFWDGGTIPFVTAADLTQLYVASGRSMLTEAGLASGKTVICEPGDLLIGTRTRVGNCAIAKHRMGASQDITRARLKSNCLPEFFRYFIAHAASELAFYSQGTSIQGIKRETLDELKIPAPPLAEQRRIVARIEALVGRSQKLSDLNVSLVEDMTRLLRAEYKRITEDAPTKPFRDVAKLVRRWVKTKPDQNYPETGIRSFGKGTFHKPALTGEQLGNKRICRIKAGDLVFMNVFAWEGAIAVAQPEDEGRVASHRFMMHEVVPDQATAEFLCYYFLTERGLEQIRGASPGSAGRNRTLGITKLEKIPVPVPPIEAQRRFAKLRKLYFQLQRLHQEAEAELTSFTPSLLAKAFRGEL